MVDRDIVLEKIKNIQNCLKRIKDKTKGGPSSLDDLDTEEIFVLNLQRAVQSTIDLASHVVSSEGLGLPDDLAENFRLLQKAGVIDAVLMKKMISMVGFRNIAVHEYSEVDTDVLRSILKENLKDIEDFYALVLERYKM
ncbi:MAG: transcriptional regulator [Deltaproteobacteria bacterium CG11_big_fil_rev_8_21_14_0_20_49_13]|nr:MAG: transcriptional regulator [Deltaproteobacteria bacterium CG11_big_fil_rev_8_21_14_0_20_49_13]